MEGRKGQDRRHPRLAAAYDPDEKPRPRYSYLDIVRCGGRTSRLAAKKKKEKPKKVRHSLKYNLGFLDIRVKYRNRGPTPRRAR